MESNKYTLEADVDDYVKKHLESLGLVKNMDYNEKSHMSDYLKEALKGASKTKKRVNSGQPDFTIEKYRVPVIIEDKLHSAKLINKDKKNRLKFDDNSIKNYAVNGAVYYAQRAIESKKYKEFIAIGIAGDSNDAISIAVYYVFSPSIPPKEIPNCNNLNFLESEASFKAFYNEVTITDNERHKILISSRNEILKHSEALNKLMNNFNISTDQRVVYVSGMLLAMQDIIALDGALIKPGLVPDDLKSIETEQSSDSRQILNHITEFLLQKAIDNQKQGVMIAQFRGCIESDPQRDKKRSVDRIVSKLCRSDASITKQIFLYLYENVYLAIDTTHGALDIMAEMYSTFLKYALSDGAPLGKVLTPPYITTLMARLVDIDRNSRVVDLATGSSAFLVAAMDMMIRDAKASLSANSTAANTLIDKIKREQLLGIEIDSKMYTLAVSNMIMRGDGSTTIKQGDAFEIDSRVYSDFKADRLLINPPFSHKDLGLPFLEHGLEILQKGGVGAIIIQDSAGAGKASDTAKRILQKHTMLASIKMPLDLFTPNANIGTSIYIFRAHKPHNFQTDVVKFIDFRKDGYKRTKRAIKETKETGSPEILYNDVYFLYKSGRNALKNPSFHPEYWNLDMTYAEDFITGKGTDWNATQHIMYDTKPAEIDFHNHINQKVAWDISRLFPSFLANTNSVKKPANILPFEAEKIFVMENVTPSYDVEDLRGAKGLNHPYDYITRTSRDRGIHSQTDYIAAEGMQNAGTFSLGLLQKDFFYRERQWYAGQFVKVVSCRKADLDRDAKLYLEVVLNKLKPVLPSAVRDVEDVFYRQKLYLPATQAGEVDYAAMSSYVQALRDSFVSSLKKSLP